MAKCLSMGRPASDYDKLDVAPVSRPRARTRPVARVGRNDPCPCGSGRKYKKCCLPRG